MHGFDDPTQIKIFLSRLGADEVNVGCLSWRNDQVQDTY